ncbi:MlaD family protein [Nocardioides daejeonensis]|uniref:MlaD family protein n=1 Tax=Nocardioides daejeonensis TaxID=1046556 RepID=UPI0013A56E3F|nr:MlaD family protein [Nocardioides daejeonensis]
MSRTVRFKLCAFVVIALLATGYLAVRYLGVGTFGGDYRVSVSLTETGGLFKNGEVTYRGVPVGRIADLRATSDGVEVSLRIEGDAPPIPADVQVVVANRSAIGEQYLDLRGEDSEEHLEDGDHIDGTAAQLPPPIDLLLRSGRDFVASVPKDDLATVIDETYDWTRDGAEPLRQMNTTLQQFAEAAEANFLTTSSLIRNSGQVLDTQLASQESIRGFSRDLSALASTLRSSDGDLRELIRNTPATAREFQRVIQEVGGPLGSLMANLVTPAQVFGINASGVEDAMIRLPEAFSIGWAVTSSQGYNLGLAQTYFDPLPCTTGYGGTTVRPGLEESGGKPFNLEAGCSLSPSSGANVRGPKSVKSAPPVRMRVATSLGELMGQ